MSTSKPRVAAVVGLTLLEVIREQDLPVETLESEDTTVTMPRRLGLSDVVEQQIQRYRAEVRRGRKITDDEFRDLVRLVIRRPDSEEVFFKAGLVLSGSAGAARRTRFLPRAVVFALVRRSVKRRMKRLFGRRIGGFAQGPFTIEGRSLIFTRSDPGGDACRLLSGLCEGAVQLRFGADARVAHTLCESRGDPLCRWSVIAEAKPKAPARSEILPQPEPEVG